MNKKQSILALAIIAVWGGSWFVGDYIANHMEADNESYDLVEKTLQLADRETMAVIKTSLEDEHLTNREMKDIGEVFKDQRRRDIERSRKQLEILKKSMVDADSARESME